MKETRCDTFMSAKMNGLITPFFACEALAEANLFAAFAAGNSP